MKKKGGKMVPNCKPVGSVKEASAVLDANTKISKDEKKKKKEVELRRLLQHAIAVKKGQAESVEVVDEAKVDEKLPEYKRATARDKRYGNPHGSHALGGGLRQDRRADHEAKRGVKEHHQKDANGKVIEHELSLIHI